MTKQTGLLRQNLSHYFLLGILVVFSACSSKDYTSYIDPNIGSVATLLTTKNPTVHRPHSMVRVFPLTRPRLNDRYLSDKIYGFAFNMPAYRMGTVTELMPTQGKIALSRDKNASGYDHDMEVVHPWFHQVLLEDHDITAAWTTTERTVLYRFNFSQKDSCNLIFRSADQASFAIRNENSISGWEEFKDMKQYFYAEFSQPFTESGTFTKDKPDPGVKEQTGSKTGVFVSYLKLNEPVTVKIGISYISEEQAKENLQKETSGKNFNQVKDESHQIWKAAINRIKVEGGTERQKRIFYTCLYRASERMVDISEYGKYFSGYDHQIHETNGRPFFVDDWLWDTFRCLHPLGLILNPQQQSDMVQSYVNMYQQSNWMPGFPQFYGDFPAMIGFHTAPLVWDTYRKGVQNFDVEKAYEGLKKNATQGTMLPWRAGPMCSLDSFYIANGWYPALNENDSEPEPMVDGFEKRQAVALSLEHSYDDWCLAQLAKALNKTDDFAYFLKRSANYKKVYNPKTGYMSPRLANGDWVEPFDPQLSGGIGSRMYYAENNSCIWTFNVMHDIPGLIDLMGGNDKFVDRLDNLFNEPTRISKWQFMGQFPDATGLNGMFPAGNEPSFHVPYLYNYVGQPWKTQRRIREILDMWFDDSPLGLAGDEDGGALCSWYVFSAMGFYPVTPGSNLYAIGSPFFNRITIDLPDGKTFRVDARNCSKKNKYIQSARLNGTVINRPWLMHSELMNGGKLELTMGDRPNKQWGTDIAWYKQYLDSVK
ncbi:MAG: GH92 family glycosyl hydrolase [Prolixibacteraceae bacterium]|nr:GH92 family glycosyl hydrolase [Prolixibacteraceae bacterium]